MAEEAVNELHQLAAVAMNPSLWTSPYPDFVTQQLQRAEIIRAEFLDKAGFLRMALVEEPECHVRENYTGVECQRNDKHDQHYAKHFGAVGDSPETDDSMNTFEIYWPASERVPMALPPEVL